MGYVNFSLDVQMTKYIGDHKSLKMLCLQDRLSEEINELEWRLSSVLSDIIS